MDLRESPPLRETREKRKIRCTAPPKEPCITLQMRSTAMRRITGWIIGGLVTMALWVPGAGAQSSRQMPQGLQHNWSDVHQDRENLRHDRWDMRHDRSQLWQDRRAGNQNAIPADCGNLQRDSASFQRDRAELWRDRAELRSDRRTFWRDWYTVRHHHHER